MSNGARVRRCEGATVRWCEGARVKRAAWVLLSLVAVTAFGAPWLAPNPPDRRFDDLLYAPPTRIRVLDESLRAPFIHPLRVVSRLERKFEPVVSERATLRWFADGTLVTGRPDEGAPLGRERRVRGWIALHRRRLCGH